MRLVSGQRPTSVLALGQHYLFVRYWNDSALLLFMSSVFSSLPSVGVFVVSGCRIRFISRTAAEFTSHLSCLYCARCVQVILLSAQIITIDELVSASFLLTWSLLSAQRARKGVWKHACWCLVCSRAVFLVSEGIIQNINVVLYMKIRPCLHDADFLNPGVRVEIFRCTSRGGEKYLAAMIASINSHHTSKVSS